MINQPGKTHGCKIMRMKREQYGQRSVQGSSDYPATGYYLIT